MKDVENLKQSNLQGTQSFGATMDRMNARAHLGRVFTSYKTLTGDYFTLDNIIVNDNVTIVQQWAFDPLLVCSTDNAPNTSLLANVQNGDIIGVACALKNCADIKVTDDAGSIAMLLAVNNHFF